MNERLLHFIWEFQYFNHRDLRTEACEEVLIIHPGKYNTHQGPDFLEAKIKIGETLWAGSVELHLKTSDWHLHKHHLDQNYDNVILHVVWEDDKPASIKQKFPIVELQPCVPVTLLSNYEELMRYKSFVPCENHLPMLSEIAWINWKERLITERLENRSTEIIRLLNSNNAHWEATFWQLIARNFGMKINADIFFEMSKLININILGKHKNQIHQIEALLFGTTNLLPDNTQDEYALILNREYKFLAKKYSLPKLSLAPFFLRMRPANFPSIRLAQLAVLIHTSTHLFSRIKDTTDVPELRKMFSVTANDYWHYHYQLGEEPGEYFPKTLGKSMIDNIFINTVIPTLFSYGIYHQIQVYKDRALQWLQEIPSEKNTIIRTWNSFNVKGVNALESQALLELKKNYCDYKRCLNCNVGKKILSPD